MDFETWLQESLPQAGVTQEQRLPASPPAKTNQEPIARLPQIPVMGDDRVTTMTLQELLDWKAAWHAKGRYPTKSERLDYDECDRQLNEVASETEMDWEEFERNEQEMDTCPSPTQRNHPAWTEEYERDRRIRKYEEQREQRKRLLSPPRTPPHLRGPGLYQQQHASQRPIQGSSRITKGKPDNQKAPRRPITRSCGTPSISLHHRKGYVKFWHTRTMYVLISYEQYLQDYDREELNKLPWEPMDFSHEDPKRPHKTPYQRESHSPSSRLVKMTADDELEDEEEAIKWIETTWEKDHLKCNWNTDFTRGSIPPLVNLDQALKILADNAPKVKNPKPDLTYGLLPAAFSADAQRINNKHGAVLTLNLVHLFFVVEAKSAEKPIDEAQNQCARGGAAVVRLKRKFDSLAEGTYQDNEAQHGEEADEASQSKRKIPIDHYRTDTEAFAISPAIVPRYAMMFVHWAEKAYSKEGELITINWHANWIADYNLVNPMAWIELHRDIDNVLDWGVLTRKQELDDICNKILEREQSRKKQKT